MRYTTLGVIGHVDHGKTALVKALTGTDTDRLREEKERGISIALGYAHLELPSGGMGIIDAPGHERFIRTMISGATGMTAAVLVVDVNEGVKPQTVEHLDIARLLGVRHGVIAITKCDSAESDLAAIVEDDVRQLVAGTFLEPAPIVRSSAITGEGIFDLRRAFDAILRECEAPVDEGWAYLPIDRAFTMTGFGTIVTGTLRRGSIVPGEELEVFPKGIRARVREVQSHNASAERALPGFRTAVNLRGVEKAALGRGDVAAPPGSITVSKVLDVQVTLLAAAPPLKNRQALRLLFGTTETIARAHLLDRDALAPGASCVMQLRLDDPAPVLNGEPFILRSYSPMRTIGGGRFLGAANAGYKRRDVESLRRLEALAKGAVEDRVVETVRAFDIKGIGLDALAQSVRLSLDALTAKLEGLPLIEIGGYGFVHREVAERLGAEMVSVLQEYHKANPTLRGMPKEQFNGDKRLRLAEPLLEYMLGEWSRRGEIVVEQSTVRAAKFTPAGALSAAQNRLLAEIEEAFRADGLTPPRVDDVLAGDRERTRLYRYLLQQGTLVAAEVTTRNRTFNPAIAFHRTRIDEAAGRLGDHFGANAFTASSAKDVLGITRKYLIPLLEAMDALGMTTRKGDERVITVAR